MAHYHLEAIESQPAQGDQRQEDARAGIDAGYQPRVCSCGHTEGDHRSGGQSFGHRLRFGVCLNKGCGCREFDGGDD